MGCFRHVTTEDVEQIVESLQSPVTSPAFEESEALLSLLSRCLPAVLSSQVGRLNKEIGAIGEEIATHVVTAVFDAPTDTAFSKGDKGIDAMHTTSDGVPLIVEVKTTTSAKSFANHLGQTLDGRQASDRWIVARGADASESVVLGVKVVPGHEWPEVTIYAREDPDAREWEPLLTIDGNDVAAILEAIEPDDMIG